ncbi:16S rRNA (guanine(527)-N(7))-methyltransferase RsmG [candidate division TM6 bacterium RIFCSPHIGHO2_12_FULL_36_22]|nr:MAG: 16S rRNA (guanine(527)-N(7))-methyltransferase RsmG [candidate division TM6 bacterium RIFCSPHIGHO2_12_FULL_36_22]
MDAKKTAELWGLLQKKYSLSDHQLHQFKQYAAELQEWNAKFNITALTSIDDILVYHFDDSLILSKYVDLKAFNCIADVGTGGGFPGIPLKILYPHLEIILIEVSNKRLKFLEHMISLLSLDRMILYSHDWKTFVRKTDFPVDMVVARASLRPEELSFMFKPSSLYKNAVLIYWASDQWITSDLIKSLITKQVEFDIGSKKRQLIFFQQK